MRCSCMICGVYMIQSDDAHLGCVCPECGNRCTACLGTHTVMDKETVRSLKSDPFLTSLLLERFSEDSEES